MIDQGITLPLSHSALHRITGVELLQSKMKGCSSNGILLFPQGELALLVCTWYKASVFGVVGFSHPLSFSNTYSEIFHSKQPTPMLTVSRLMVISPFFQTQELMGKQTYSRAEEAQTASYTDQCYFSCKIIPEHIII